MRKARGGRLYQLTLQPSLTPLSQRALSSSTPPSAHALHCELARNRLPSSSPSPSSPPFHQLSPSHLPSSSPRRQDLTPSTLISLPAPMIASSSSLVPEGWSLAQGTELSPEVIKIFAEVTASLSKPYKDEAEEQQDWARDGRARDGVGRETEDALVHLTLNGPKSSTSGGYGMFPTSCLADASTQESRRGGDDESRAYFDFLATKGSLARPSIGIRDGIMPMERELGSAVEHLEATERRRCAEMQSTASWQPFASSSSSKFVERPSGSGIAAWAQNPVRFSRTMPRKTGSLSVPRRQYNDREIDVVADPDSFTSLPPLPWASSWTPTNLVVDPRPSSYLNVLRSHAFAPWQESVEDGEHRRLSTNLADLSNLHTSLIDQDSLLTLLNQFLPLRTFQGDRRREALDGFFALGLARSRALLHTLLRAVARRGDLIETKEEIEGILEQMRKAGLEETAEEEKIETLALVERVYLQNGNVVAANEIKAQLYAFTPTPPRPTDLLLQLLKPSRVHKVQEPDLLSLIEELVASKQEVPDEIINIYATVIKADAWTFDGVLRAAQTIEEKTKRSMTSDAWKRFLFRSFVPIEAESGGHPTSKRDARTTLQDVLKIFARIETPSPESIAAGTEILHRAPTHPSPFEEKIAAIIDVYETVLQQIVNPSPTSSRAKPPLALSFPPSIDFLSTTQSEQLRDLFTAATNGVLDTDVPFTLPIASFLARIQQDHERLLGPFDWHQRILFTLRDPPYPLKPSNLSSLYSILVTAFPTEMQPLEIYWSFLSRAGKTSRSQPLATTRAILEIVQTRLNSGKPAYAEKTMLELVETLKGELQKSDEIRAERGVTKRKEESLDRDPRRALLQIQTVALSMDPAMLRPRFWCSLVEATYFSETAQSAAWKNLVKTYPDHIEEGTIISRFGTSSKANNVQALLGIWPTVLALPTSPSPPIWNAWLDALLLVEQHNRFVKEIISKSPEPASDDLLRWTLERLHEAGSQIRPAAALPVSLRALSIGSATEPVLRAEKLEQLLAKLRNSFGERWDRVETQRSVDELSKPPGGLEMKTLLKTTSPPRTAILSPVRLPAWKMHNLPPTYRHTLILEALASRGVPSTHIAFQSLVDILTQIGSFETTRGSYFDVRALFHPPAPLTGPQFTSLLSTHLDLLNVHPATSFVPARSLLPAPTRMLKVERGKGTVEEGRQGLFGLKGGAKEYRVVKEWGEQRRRWKAEEEEEKEERVRVLDFGVKRVEW